MEMVWGVVAVAVDLVLGDWDMAVSELHRRGLMRAEWLRPAAHGLALPPVDEARPEGREIHVHHHY